MGPRVSRLNLHNGVVNYHSENCSCAVFGSCVGTTLLISFCLGLSFVLPEPAKVMFWSHVLIYLFIYWFVCMYVCMLPTFLKNYLTELHEIFRDDLSSSKDQSIRFWE